MNNMEKKTNYIEILKDNELPIEHLISIDSEGYFVIREPQNSDYYLNYSGRIIDNGILYVKHVGWSYPSDFDINTELVSKSLVANNIFGYEFVAGVETQYDKSKAFGVDSKTTRKIKSDKSKIESLFTHYDLIIEALKNGANDDFIKESFGLDYFESSVVNSKTR